ncbi:MAG: tripartite tricarboxylate transporter TctB family protein [Thermovirgaceae bacterium]
MKRLNSDIIGGVIVICAALFFQISKEEFTRLAAMFPNAVIPAVGALGVAILIKGLVKPHFISPEVLRTNHIMIFTLLSGFAWVFLMTRIGFILSGFLIMTFLLLIFRRSFTFRNMFFCAMLAAVEIGLVYLVFGKLLNVSFPTGALM